MESGINIQSGIYDTTESGIDDTMESNINDTIEGGIDDIIESGVNSPYSLLFGERRMLAADSLLEHNSLDLNCRVQWWDQDYLVPESVLDDCCQRHWQGTWHYQTLLQWLLPHRNY